MKKAALLTVVLLTAVALAGCGQEGPRGAAESLKAASPAAASVLPDSSGSYEASSGESKIKPESGSASVKASGRAAASYPVIERDKALVPGAGVAESGEYVYVLNEYQRKMNLLRIDKAAQTMTELTDFSIGRFALAGGKIYYTASHPLSGRAALYVMPETGGDSRLLTDNHVAGFWIYRNRLFYQTKDAGGAVEEYQLYRMDLDGRNIIKLGSGSILTIFKDRIYYARKETVYSMTADGREAGALFPYCLTLDVRPDALYYFEDHPAPRGQELWKRSADGTAAMLCKAAGYMFHYTDDDYLVYISHEAQGLVKMRLDGSRAKTLLRLPENLFGCVLTDWTLFTWESEADGKFYCRWTDLSGKKAPGRIYMGMFEMGMDESSPPPGGGQETEPPAPAAPWTKPYDPAQMLADCRSFAESRKLTVTAGISLPDGAGAKKIYTAQEGGGAREKVTSQIMTLAMAGWGDIGIRIEPDGQNAGDYIIYVIYGLRAAASSNPAQNISSTK